MRASVSEIGGSEHFGVRPTLIVERYLNKITALNLTHIKPAKSSESSYFVKIRLQLLG